MSELFNMPKVTQSRMRLEPIKNLPENKLPRVVCLCPSFRKPACLNNAIEQFKHQTYPNRCLYVCEDSGELDGPRNISLFPVTARPPKKQETWEIYIDNVGERWESLPAKYNNMVTFCSDAEIFVIWEDDDIFFPDHIENHVRALSHAAHNYNIGVSKPKEVISLTNPDKPEIEVCVGNMHGSMAFTREAFNAVGGWTESLRAGFDLEMVDKLTKYASTRGGIINTCEYSSSACPHSFVFRWGSSNAHHSQWFMNGDPNDETWYAKLAERVPKTGGFKIEPKLDTETAKMYDEWYNIPENQCKRLHLKTS